MKEKTKLLSELPCTHYWDCRTLSDGVTVQQVCRWCEEVKEVKPKFNKGNPEKSALYDGCFDFALSHNDIRIKDYERRGRSSR